MLEDGGDWGCEFWHMHTVNTHKSIHAHKIHPLCSLVAFALISFYDGCFKMFKK